MLGGSCQASFHIQVRLFACNHCGTRKRKIRRGGEEKKKKENKKRRRGEEEEKYKKRINRRRGKISVGLQEEEIFFLSFNFAIV